MWVLSIKVPIRKSLETYLMILVYIYIYIYIRGSLNKLYIYIYIYIYRPNHLHQVMLITRSSLIFFRYPSLSSIVSENPYRSANSNTFLRSSPSNITQESVLTSPPVSRVSYSSWIAYEIGNERLLFYEVRLSGFVQISLSSVLIEINSGLYQIW